MGRVSGVINAMGFHMGQDQKRQIIMLDREFDQMESKIKVLEAENLDLQAKVNPLQRENERLKQQVQQKATSKNIHQLERTEIDMMKFIGDKKSVAASEIVTEMAMHSVQVEHFLGRLLKANYIVQHPGIGGMVPATYSLDDKGNAYLVENRLVPLASHQAEQVSNPKGHHCDHCGSTQLWRTGSKPDPTFHDLGIKMAMYSCLACGKESGFTNDEG